MCTAQVGPIEYQIALSFEHEVLKAYFALKKYSVWLSSAEGNLTCCSSAREAGLAATKSTPIKKGRSTVKFRPPKLRLRSEKFGRDEICSRAAKGDRKKTR